MASGTPTPTFRDPAGSLSLEDDFAVRTIHASARDEVVKFVSSPFCGRLQQRGDMVGITIRETPAGLQLVHPKVPVPTYPWEWTPSQWLAAAELTLSLCEEALTEGWVLKDATPLNILFVGSRPVLVDVLSFEPWNPAPPPGSTDHPVAHLARLRPIHPHLPPPAAHEQDAQLAA